MRIATISQPRYMPYLGYFHRIAFSNVFIILDTVQFKPREWDRRNRVRVYGDKGSTWLTVPVQKAPRNTVITDIRIDNSQDWQSNHWRTLESSYGQSPYFDLYAPGLKEFYTTRYEFIRDLNIDMTRYFCECLGISTEITLASDLRYEGTSSDLLVSLCQAVGADIYWSGIDGRNYINETRFHEAGLSLMYQDYQHPVYEQIHGEPFQPYMGIVDLLFNCGQESLDILMMSNDIPTSPDCPASPGDRPPILVEAYQLCPINEICSAASQSQGI